MSFQYSSYGIVLMISAAIVLSLAVYSYKKRSSNLHIYFIFLMLSVFFWCLGSAMEFFSIAVWAKIFWIKISYIGVATAAPLWFIFILDYAKYEKYLKPFYIGLLFVIPVIVLIMAFTNQWHGLLWPSITPASNQPGSLLIYGHGPVFWSNIIYSFIMVLTGILILIRMFITSSMMYRLQISVLILSGAMPLISSILYTSKVIPIPGLDVTPFGLTISGVLIALSIFKFQFLDILPVAHKILFKNMVNGVLVFDDNDRLIEVNSAANLIGIRQEDIGMNADDILSRFPELESMYNKHQPESEIFLGDPVNRWIQVQVTPIYHDKNIFQGHLLIIQDINKRKKMEKELKKSLEERDLMMKEIHHRVKNNLMIIQSLLQLQSKYIKDEDALNIFRESQNRVKSMARVHQRLYQHDDIAKIDFSSYPRTLALDIFRSYASDPNKINLNVDADNVMLDIDTAIPLGLILNELISNSLKHAFPQGKNGQLTVKFNLEDDKYKLIVSDDGIGIPEGLNYEKSDSLGLKLVYSLSDQIGAKVKVDTTNGTKFEITFDKQD
jgi:PAS domain S-box-containing protein